MLARAMASLNPLDPAAKVHAIVENVPNIWLEFRRVALKSKSVPVRNPERTERPRMKKILIATFAACTSAAPAFAEEPVVGVTISIAIDGEQIGSATTDQDGVVRFVLPREGVYELSAPDLRDFTTADRSRFQSDVFLDDELVLTSCLCEEGPYAMFGAYRGVREATIRIQYYDN